MMTPLLSGGAGGKRRDLSRTPLTTAAAVVVALLLASCTFLYVPSRRQRGGGATVDTPSRQQQWTVPSDSSSQQQQRRSVVRTPDALAARLPSSYSTLFAGERGLDAVLYLSSLALHHPGAHVYISSDSNTYEWFLEHAKVLFYRLNLHWSLALDKYNMRLKREEMEASKTWNDFMLEKVGVMEAALRHHNDTMLLDADFVLLEPVYVPPADAGFQLGVSPHYMKKSQGDRFGIYNGGMLWTNQVGLGEVWRQASAVSRYYEQAAIEDLTKQYPYFEFGPEHNVGFWRPVHDDIGPNEFYSHLYFDAPTQKIMLRNQTVATFHTHVLTRYPWEVGNKFSELFVSMLRMSQDPNYERIASIIQWATDGCLPPQMVL